MIDRRARDRQFDKWRADFWARKAKDCALPDDTFDTTNVVLFPIMPRANPFEGAF